MKHSSSERRKFLRVEEGSVLSCEECAIPRSNQKFSAVSKDLSAGGLMFSARAPFDLGTVLRFEISIAGWQKYKPEFKRAGATDDKTPLFALGTVVRAEQMMDGTYEIGVRLDGVDEGHRMALEQYVKSRAKEQRV
jgi:c-di-GMP-binding flagellar brake protein YcgR